MEQRMEVPTASSVTHEVLKHATVALALNILWRRGLEVWRAATDDLGSTDTLSMRLPWVFAVSKTLVHRRMRGHPAVAPQRRALWHKPVAVLKHDAGRWRQVLAHVLVSKYK